MFAPLLEEVTEGGVAHAEVAFAWDPVTGEATRLGAGIGRDYSRAPAGWAVGSFDLLVLYPSPRVALLADYKSHAPGQHIDAREQLRTGAMMAARALGLDAVIIRTGLMGEMSARWADEELLDAEALDLVAEERSDQLTRPIGAPVPGPWCSQHYCPHRAYCRATVAACEALVPAADYRLDTTIADDAHAAWTLSALKLVEARAKEIKRAVLAYADARAGGIVGPDGRVYSNVPYVMESPVLDAPGATEEIGAAGAAKAIERKVTWSAIAKQIGPKAAKTLREKLHDMGATRATTKPDYDWRKPAKDPDASA